MVSSKTDTMERASNQRQRPSKGLFGSIVKKIQRFDRRSSTSQRGRRRDTASDDLDGTTNARSRGVSSRSLDILRSPASTHESGEAFPQLPPDASTATLQAPLHVEDAYTPPSKVSMPPPYLNPVVMPGTFDDDPTTPGSFPVNEASCDLDSNWLARLPDYLPFDLRQLGRPISARSETPPQMPRTPPTSTQSPAPPQLRVQPSGAEDDRFEYDEVEFDDFKGTPSRKLQRKVTPSFLTRPVRRNKTKANVGATASEPAADDTWSIIQGRGEMFPGSAPPEFHPSAPNSRTLSRTLHELDEMEINTFLQHFSRHTREVHMPGTVQHFTRMPQWSDFAYSSDEDCDDTQPLAPNEVLAQRHRRSRLLMHIDRGLQQLSSPETSAAASPVVTTPDAAPVEVADLLANEQLSTMGSPVPPRLPASPPRSFDINDPLSESIDTLPGRLRDDMAHSDEHVVIDDHVDGVAFCIAYILAVIEQYLPYDLDEAPVTEYRESRARSHVERLYIIAPFWEQLALTIHDLYCWESPRRTAAAAMIYFVLWYTDMIPTSFFLMLLYYVLQFRYMPQDESRLHRRVKQRMARAQGANRLAERLKRRSRLDILDIYKHWAGTYGAISQVIAGDVADYHEKVKNLLLWRNPRASQRSAFLIALATIFVTVCSTHTVIKTLLLLLGITFFGLLPLRSLYPRYRRALDPLWWLVLGSPTDAQYAVHLLRQRHRRYEEWLQHNEGMHMPNAGVSSAGASASEHSAPSSPGERRHAEGIDPQNSHATAPGKERSRMDKRKLGSYLCQHYAVPGHLHVTPTHLYFLPLKVVGGMRKHYVTRLEDVVGLRKTHAARFWLWSSNGLKVSRRNKNSLLLSNMAHRDDAFNLIITLGSKYVQHS